MVAVIVIVVGVQPVEEAVMLKVGAVLELVFGEVVELVVLRLLQVSVKYAWGGCVKGIEGLMRGEGAKR